MKPRSNLCAYSDEPYEGPNDFLRPSGRTPRKPKQFLAPIWTNPMKAQTTLRTYSANLKAIIALIFFCFLFFHQGKKRKSEHGGEAPAKAPTNLLRLPSAPHEGQNNSLHLFRRTL